MKTIPTDRPVSYVLEGSYTVRGGKRYGPYGAYWYAYWMEQGVKKKAYVGKERPADYVVPPELRPPPMSAPKTELPAPKTAPLSPAAKAVTFVRSLRSLTREKARKAAWNRGAILRRQGHAGEMEAAAIEGAFEELCRQQGWAPPKARK